MTAVGVKFTATMYLAQNILPISILPKVKLGVGGLVGTSMALILMLPSFHFPGYHPNSLITVAPTILKNSPSKVPHMLRNGVFCTTALSGLFGTQLLAARCLIKLTGNL